MPSVYKRIVQYNADRLPEYTALKMQFMAENAFRFFRGTCHLFYEDLAQNISWKDTTKAWICGDLHLENFGSYKGNNGVVYFDLNDFDEALLAPASWELSRLLTSIYVGAGVGGYDAKTADRLARKALQVYRATLQLGKPVIVEKQTASGLLRYFLQQVAERNYTDFIKTRVSFDKKKQARLLTDNKKVYPVTKATREKVSEALHKWFRKQMPESKSTVADVAFRVAGTGSVGVSRYIALLQDGAKWHLLDLKASEASSLAKYVRIKQPSWSNEAERIVTLQNRVQQVAPKMLHTLKIDGLAYVMKMLQPSQDRMDLTLCKGKLSELEDIINTMAMLSASGQLRSSGRQNSSIADELIAFGANGERWPAILRYAKQYAVQVQSDYEAYKRDYQDYKEAGSPKAAKKKKKNA